MRRRNRPLVRETHFNCQRWLTSSLAAPGKKKKGLAAKIAEREAKEAEQRRKQEELAEMTPAQKKAMIEKEEEANAEDFLGEDDADKWVLFS